MKKSIAAILLSLFVLSGAALAQDASLPRFEEADCAFAVPAGAEVTCGYVLVPENRSDENSATIQLYTAIYRSQAEAPQADPFIFLQGGPGGEIVELLAQQYSTVIAPILAERDFIVFDQRGNGLSVPSLSCPTYNDFGAESYSRVFGLEEFAEVSYELLMECRDELVAAGADLSAYTSAENAADVADIAAALGYEQVNLYGASYGTRLAQTVIRDHAAIVRTAIMDSAIPLEVNLYNEQAGKTQDGFDRVFAACAADAACAASYPDLPEVFEGLLNRLAAEPLSHQIFNPISGETIDVMLDDRLLIGAMFFPLQLSSLVTSIPQTIYAVDAGDLSGLDLGLLLPLILGDTIYYGTFLSVNCHEEAFATTAEAIDADNNAFPLMAGFANLGLLGGGESLLRVCEDWGAKAFDPIEVEVVSSDIPVLALAGQFDPATPPIWTQQTAENFSNSQYFEFPGLGHAEGLSVSCPQSIILSFVSDPSQTLDASCIADMSVSFTGAALPEGSESESAAAEEAEAINLVAFEDAQAGVSGLLPEGWTGMGNGTYVRGANALDQTALILLAAPAAPADLLTGIGGSLGVESFDPAGEYDDSNRIWTLYQANLSLMGFSLVMDVAFTDVEGVTLGAILLTEGGDRDSLFASVFFPVLDALQILE